MGKIEVKGLADRLRADVGHWPSRTRQVIPSYRLNKRIYIPPIPVQIITAVTKANAETALPLILAAHRQLVMKRCQETPISGAVWEVAGKPSAKKRTAIMAKLKKLRSVIRISVKRTPRSYYRVSKGPMWNKQGTE